jgi:ubiquinone/menaquinone biosynthesis C-methylase UbiE
MAAYNQLFALAYDPFLALGERAGMRDIRRRVLADSAGRVLEIGAGSGLNVGLYPEQVETVTFTEPDPAMRRQFVKRVARQGRAYDVVDASAENLPFDDQSFDTVVSTLVLCTVPDLPSALREIERVLAADGQLLLVEHVRTDQPRLASWQDRLQRPWQGFAAGCHCNRDTLAALDNAGFGVDDLESGRWTWMPPIVAPLIVGRAGRRRSR